MNHLTPLEIEAVAAGEVITVQARRHLVSCEQCQARAAVAEKLEHALGGLGRVDPSADLSARIIAQLPRAARQNSTQPVWLVPLTLAAALASFVLAYQTAFLLQANGAFDLLATYSSQPQIVTTYPSAALDALTAVIPWATVSASAVALVIAFGLVYRLAGARAATRTQVLAARAR